MRSSSSVDHDTVVELDRAVPDLLDRLVALAGHDDDVTGAGGLEAVAIARRGPARRRAGPCRRTRREPLR